MFNTIMIAGVLIIAALLVLLWLRRTANSAVAQEEEDPYTIKYLVDFVNQTFETTLRRSMKDMNLTRAEVEREERIKRELRTSIRRSSVGDMQAKKFVKASILGIICNARFAHTITEETIDRVIDFSHPDKVKAREKFETMVYIYSNKVLDKNGMTYKADGIKKMFEDYQFNQPIPGTNKYIVTEKQINQAYPEIIRKYPLSFNDKREILAQRIFEDMEGFGAVDILLDTSVDEVEGGVSGIPMDSYEVKSSIPEDAKYSFEAIWIIMSGLTINLDFLSFGSQEELIRVCNNIYKFDAPYPMSKEMGKVVATMKDGSRIVVVRPPFADSYAFLARKFDSAPSVDPAKLIPDEGSEMVQLMMKWLVHSSRNIAITGDQGTGKTTFMKSMIRFIREDYSIRIQELTPELNLRYTYPTRNIMSFRETDTISAQDGLDLQKKSSGQVDLLGEISTAEAASWMIQTAKVASKMTMFTHHAKNTDDLIVSLRNNMMQVNNYTNDAAVDEMIAQALDVDVHLERKKGHRFIGRITEIIPIRDRAYPEKLELTDSMEDMEKKAMINNEEFQKRSTDRILFTHKDIIRFNEDKNIYEFVQFPSDEMLDEMREQLTNEEEAEMDKDFARIRELVAEQKAISV